MRVLVCGSRHYGYRKEEYQHIFDVLNQFAIENSKFYNPNDNWMPFDIEIISGAAKGVDTFAIDWAVSNEGAVKFKEYPADWNKHGKAAGHIRNKQMLDEGKPDLVIAFWDGKSPGTKNMIEQAQKAGVPVKIVEIGNENSIP